MTTHTHKKKELRFAPLVVAVIAIVCLLTGLGLGWLLFGNKGWSAISKMHGDGGRLSEGAATADALSFSGVIIGVGVDRLVVYVSQGAGVGTNVTVLVDADTVLRKIVAKTDAELAAETNYADKIKNWDRSKGLPPPLDPVSDPYKILSIKVSDLVPDDVADFTATGDPSLGQLTAKTVSWTWHMDRGQPTLNR